MQTKCSWKPAALAALLTGSRAAAGARSMALAHAVSKGRSAHWPVKRVTGRDMIFSVGWVLVKAIDKPETRCKLECRPGKSRLPAPPPSAKMPVVPE